MLQDGPRKEEHLVALSIILAAEKSPQIALTETKCVHFNTSFYHPPREFTEGERDGGSEVILAGHDS